MNDVCAIIAASGSSARFGGIKAIEKINGVPMLAMIIIKLSFFCDALFVVLGHEKETVEKEITGFINSGWLKENKLEYLRQVLLNKVRYCYNESYQSGMFSSLMEGIRSAFNFNWALYHFVDQPFLPMLFYKEFIRQIDSSFDWIQPEYLSKCGHPVLLSKSMFASILSSDKNYSLRKLSPALNIKKKKWACSYSQVLQDIDTIDNLKNLLKESNYSLIKDLKNFSPAC